MKHFLTSTMSAIALLAAGVAARAETSYTVFKVCEDQHVIRTSDGAEAGHVEYIVFDPGEQRIVSSIVSGGSVGEKMVAVPFSSMRFGPEREVVLTEITRERLVSAPVIERTQITTTARFEPTVVERSFTHFGVRIDATSRTTRIEDEQRRNMERRSNTTVDVQGRARDGVPNADADRNGARDREGDRERMTRERQDGRTAARPDADNNRRGDGERDRNRPTAEAAQDAARPPAGELRRENANADGENASGNARRSAGEATGREAAPKKNAGNAEGQDAGRPARDVKAKADDGGKAKADDAAKAKADETAKAKAGEAAKAKADGARKATEATRNAESRAESSAERAAGAATEAGRKMKEPKAAEESRVPNAESSPREKKGEPKRPSGEDRSPQ